MSQDRLAVRTPGASDKHNCIVVTNEQCSWKHSLSRQQAPTEFSAMLIVLLIIPSAPQHRLP